MLERAGLRPALRPDSLMDHTAGWACLRSPFFFVKWGLGGTLSKDLLHSDTMWPWNQFWLSLWRGEGRCTPMPPALLPHFLEAVGGGMRGWRTVLPPITLPVVAWSIRVTLWLSSFRGISGK